MLFFSLVVTPTLLTARLLIHNCQFCDSTCTESAKIDQIHAEFYDLIL